MVRWIFLFIMNMLSFGTITAQTCCSGGVPYLGALRVPLTAKSDWTVSTSYIYNRNDDLVAGTDLVNQTNIFRNVQTFLLQTDYGISDRWSASVLLPFLAQNETIESIAGINEYHNSGVGDISAWMGYHGETGLLTFSFNAGLKFPTGNTSKKDDETKITLPFSFQTGSGSYDVAFLALGALPIDAGRKYVWTNQLSLKVNTPGQRFEAHPNYRFGHQFQYNMAFSRRFIAGAKLFDISGGFNWQYQTKDVFDGGLINPNTGGFWWNAFLGGELMFSPKAGMGVNGFFPLLRNLGGLQLTTGWMLLVNFNFTI